MPAWLQPDGPKVPLPPAEPLPDLRARSALAAQLAPPSMPCFSSRDAWVTYLQSAAKAQRDLHAPGPLLFRKGQPVAFNPAFFPCSDCSAVRAAEMTKEGRCKPAFLIEHLQEKEQEVEPT